MNGTRVTVLGAGTVGVCCALSLLRKGFRVTLIDRAEPGSGCSYGNAGMIQVGGCVPTATPGIIRQVPRMLLDPDGPLIIRWRHLASLSPYLLHFLASARPERVEQIAGALASLLRLAAEAYRPLIASARCEHLIRESGELYAYRSENAYLAAKPAHDLRRRHGVHIEEFAGAELHRLEPALSADFTRGVLITGSLSTRSPQLLTQALADRFVAEGGEFVKIQVEDLVIDDGKPAFLISDSGARPIGKLVLAFGAHSKRWARKLGSWLPLDSERGYHLMVPDPGIELGRPVIVGDQKFGLSSMAGGLRIAGTAELASLDAPPNYRRAHRLLKLAAAALPDLRPSEPEPWMGLRPSTPDSLPVICRAPATADAFFAFGHGHSGLTLGAITGSIVADLVAGEASPVDIAPFDIRRFGILPMKRPGAFSGDVT
ncbi:MAG: FAD-dependent oxidoreductase [Bosea sp.]|uniref:NAD(P)/FAD-dependent oxidoreductase n=1 Tax=Hyphomicrobiales TaxID=356 RepID=UPI00082D0BAC|nr:MULTISPECIES: FAD-dependent oxidoreductase [Hyphomicrobiales]MCP4561830.1 FAD-dependent oxidoreductase [Bosea sp. (in: a-proteobacteria)]MCP4738209.1 FAD-dependent oxidoreductase [Bosea sp. (in: a-proteobacteria)]MDX3804835.1 FAD-dependent oxidoreductase [Bosea sp. (in: a-proteobacteria)]